MLHSRYADVSFISDMEMEEAVSFMEYAVDQDTQGKLFLRWISGPQFEIGFDEFKERLSPKPERPEKEILAEVRGILDSFAEQRG